MNPNVDAYLTVGCGRCPLGGMPDCKVHSWQEELATLRRFILDCGLTEEVKWGVPCYTFENSNLLLLSALKNSCVVSFFNGVLLNDPHHVLQKPGENSQLDRVMRFTSLQQVVEQEDILKSLVHEAIKAKQAGLKVELKKNPEPIPEELQQKFDELPALKTAFEALTPGRQRGYILHFSSAKQPKTRAARVEKHVQKILDGKGFHDR